MGGVIQVGFLEEIELRLYALKGEIAGSVLSGTGMPLQMGPARFPGALKRIVTSDGYETNYLLPDPDDPVVIPFLLNGNCDQVLGEALSQDHPIERIRVLEAQQAGAQRMLGVNGKVDQLLIPEDVAVIGHEEFRLG